MLRGVGSVRILMGLILKVALTCRNLQNCLAVLYVAYKNFERYDIQPYALILLREPCHCHFLLCFQENKCKYEFTTV